MDTDLFWVIQYKKRTQWQLGVFPAQDGPVQHVTGHISIEKSHRGDLHPGIGMIQCHNDQRDETTLDRSGFILLHLTNIHGGIPP